MSEPTGADLARQMLNLARAEAKKRGTKAAPRPKRRIRAAIGAGRDPQGLGAVLDQLAETYGWRKPSAGAQVIIRWAELAPDLAHLAEPERFDADTHTLHLRPVSPAAATHLRLLAQRIPAQLNERTGAQTVRAVRILPPGRAPARPTGPAPERPQDSGPAAPRTRAEASPGLLAAQTVVAEHRMRDRTDPTQESRDRYFADARGTLREPEDAFSDGAALQGDLTEKAAVAEDPRERALARARAERAGRAPAVPRAFDQAG